MIAPPPGFELDQPTEAKTQTPPPPAGFVVDGPVAPKAAKAKDGSFLPEAGKAVGAGALNVTGLALKGLAVNTSRSPVEQENYAKLVADLPKIKDMSHSEWVDFQRRATSGIRGASELNLLAKARLIRDGKIDPSDTSIPLDVLPTEKLQDTGLYKTGQSIQDVATKNLPPAENYKDSWTRAIGEGVGSTVPFLATAPLGPLTGLATGAGMGMAASTGEAVERAEDEKATEAQLVEAARLAQPVGLTEQLPIEMLLERVPVPFIGPAAGAIKKIFAQALAEGGQEAVQQTAQNLIERYVYNPDQEITEGLAEAAAVGAIVGGGMKATGEGAGALSRAVRGQKDDEAPIEETPGAAVETGVAPAPSAPATQDGSGEAGTPPGQPEPSTIPAEQRAVLRRSGMADDMIDQMSPEEVFAETQAAIDAGVRINQAMVNDAARYQSLQTAPQEPVSAPEAVESIRERFNAPQARNERGMNRALDIAGQVRVPVEDLPQNTGNTARRMLDNYRARQQGNQTGTRKAPANIDAGADLDLAGLTVNPEPSEAQKAAGNYQKYHARLNGFDISIETPKGGIRSGKTLSGQPWSVKLPAHYGYIKRTEGADGDQLDVYVGSQPDSKRVYVVDQKDLGTGRFDEHKAIMGVQSVTEAQRLYEQGFSDGRGAERMGAITPMSVSEFRKWLKDGDTTKPLRLGKPAPTNDQGFPVDTKGRVKKPESLIEFLARQGGIQDQSGDLAAIGLDDRKAGFVAGAGPLVRKTGMTLDAAREMALEAGYLTDAGSGDQMPSQSTITDLLDALDQDSRNGRQAFSTYDEDHALAWMQEQGSDAREDADAEFDAILAQVTKATGLPKDDPFAQSIATAMIRDGMEMDEAAERIAIQQGEEAGVDYDAAIGEIPFFEETRDAVQPAAALADGQTGREAGERDQGSGPEGRPQGGSPQTQDRGQGRPEVGRPENDGRRDQPRPREVADDFDSAFDSALDEEFGADDGPISDTVAESPLAPTEPAVEPGADNKPQTVIPGAERISQKEQAERAGAGKKRASKPQREPGGMFDEAETAPQLFDLPARSTKDVAKSAAKSTLMGLDEVASGLTQLFGGKGKLSSGLTFDEDTYKKAVPFFKAGVAHFTDAGRDVAELVKRLVRHLAQSGMDRQAIDNMRPYVRRFVDDVQNGNITLETASDSTAAPVSTDQKVVDLVADRLLDPDGGFATITQARKFLQDNGWKPKNPDVANKEAEELIERAVVRAARYTVSASKDWTPESTFERLVGIYNRQPRLGSRTSTSMAEQAYSTPAPLAYVASRLADVKGGTTIYEPTAGNGMLLIETDPDKQAVHANELNPDRARSVTEQGFRVTQKDAMTVSNPQGTDRIIANPPFGAVRENGESRVFQVGEHKTTAIDQAIVLKTLEDMPDNGRAVFIVGSVKEGTEAQRAEYYGTSQKRKFYKRLYDNYNVVDHFTVSGDLYQKQGAGWPVDVIVIDGKGKSALKLPAASVPVLVSDWSGLKGYLDGTGKRTDTGSQQVSRPAQTERQPAGGSAESGRPAGEQRPVRQPVAGQPDAAASSPDPDRGQSESRGDGPVADLFDVGREPAGTGIVPPAKPREPRLRTEANESGQVPYRPYSRKGTSLNTLVPAALGASMDESLARIEAKHGDIDAYVARELGYSLDELPDVFSAEQIDAIALAMENVANGDAFIIGDQTGIGKGRVVAAAIRFAHRQGMTPVFVTEKPDLYGDMFRDLTDIKWPKYLGREPVIFMTNAGTSVPLDDAAVEWIAERDEAKAAGRKPPAKRGRFMPAQGTEVANKKMGEILSGKFKPDVVFTTYDQMNSVKGDETSRRRFLDSMASKAFLIMDESHNAGGQGPDAMERRKKGAAPPRSVKFRSWVSKARSVMYSSATYAKSPQVMDLYSRTDMAKAVDDAKDLPELIAKGGVPLQQVVSSMLAKAGQYARRERSFEGVEYGLEVAEVDQASYGDFAAAIRAIYDFDRSISEFRKEWIKEYLAKNGAGMGMDGGVGDLAANSTEFASIMHNIVNQMLLAIKADAAAKRAIKSLNDGEKPVIALSFTSESFVKDYADDKAISIGDEMPITFSDVVQRYLERSLRITVKEADDTKTHVYIPVQDLKADALGMYEAAVAALENADLSDLPVSPIDHIRDKITKAGFSVREITGRSTMIDYGGDKVRFVARPSDEQGSSGKRVTIKKFNDGQIDAVILNRSGSTGVSMHASSKFKDKRKRRMILAQADPNIDTHMQMLGRVHRSGQVVLPAYSQLTADIPAEARPTAVLMKKMASLNANTTASRKSTFTADAVDFMNEYGDIAAIQWAKDFPEVNMRLGSPVKFDEKGRSTVENPIQKLTGRIMLLNPQEQQELLDTLTRSYTSILEQKEAMGENALEAKAVDLQAQPLDKTEIKPATGSSPFQAAAMIERMSVKSVGRAMPPAEVLSAAADALGGHDVRNMTFGQGLDELAPKARRWAADTIERMKPEFESWLQWTVGGLKSADAKRNQTDKANEAFRKWKEIVSMAAPSSRVTIKSAGESDRTTAAVVLRIKQTGKGQNPMALSTWEVTFALPDMSRTLTIPMSQISPPSTASEAESGITIAPPAWTDNVAQLAEQFDAASKEGREDRYIATGNILAAYDQLEGKGQIVQFTMENGDSQPGVLMPRDFRTEDWEKTRRVKFSTADQVNRFLTESQDKVIEDERGVIRVENTYRGYEFELSASRAKGGVYFTDTKVRDIFDNWTKSGAFMTATVDPTTGKRLIHAMQEIGARFVATSDSELAAKIAFGDKKQYSANPTGWDAVDGGTDTTPLSSAEQAELVDIVRRVSGLDDVTFMERIKIDPGSKGAMAWGSNGDTTAGGFYSAAQDVIALALDTANRGTAYHEAFHRVQNLFLTDAERQVLSRELPRLREIVAADYAGTGARDSAQAGRMSAKEIEAEAFRIYATQKEANGAIGLRLHIGLRRAWDRIRQALRRVRNALNGMGYQTAEDIFERSVHGKMAERGGNQARGRDVAFQTAHHGSPYRFDRFSTDKIGTGEGAQAFGWGLYFAGRREVAEHYRNNLSRQRRQGTPAHVKVDGIRMMRDDMDAFTERRDIPSVLQRASRSNPLYNALKYGDEENFILHMEKSIQSYEETANIWRKRAEEQRRNPPVASTYTVEERLERADAEQRQADELREFMQRLEFVPEKAGGALFTVDIPEDSDLLDWDAPLRDQPEAVRSAIEGMVDAPLMLELSGELGVGETAASLGDMTGEQIYHALSEIYGIAPPSGSLVARVDPSFRVDNQQAASEALRAAGIPGHRYLDGGSRADGDGTRNYVIYDEGRVNVLDVEFSLAERIPAGTEPRKAPSIAIGKRMSKALTKATAKLKKMSPKDRGHADDGELMSEYLHRSFVDYLDPVRLMQQKANIPLTDLNDAYLTARLAEDKALAKMQQTHDVYIKPALGGLAKVGATVEDLHNLLYAMHVEERNRVVGERNPEDSDLYRAVNDPTIKGASGWSFNEAKQTIARLQKDKAKYRALRRAADGIHAMLRANLRDQKRAGLIGEDTYNLLTQQWKHYVPMKGFDGEDTDGNWMPSKGKGFDVRGKEFQTAVGRYSEAENVVAHAVSQAERAILREEKNQVGKAMLRFINEADPEGKQFAQVYWSDNSQIGEITKAPEVYKREIGPDGKVRTKKVANPFSRLDDVIAVKVGGRSYYIRFKDEKVGLALRKLGTAELGVLSKMVRPLTGWQSFVNTRANPAFIPINIIRDALTGGIHLLDEGFGVGGSAKAVASIPRAWAALWRDSRGRPGDGEWDKTLAEYKAAGAKINFDARMQDFDQQLQAIQKETARAAGDVNKAKAVWDMLAKFLTDLNDAGENGMRLAAFKAVREKQGRSAKQAAFMARDLTVDFKKHGEIGPAMNSWFVFFNAALQGNYNVAKRMAHSKAVRRVIAAGVFAGLLQHFWNSFAAGDDDDGESFYDKLLRNEPYRFERQMLFFIPGTEQYVSFPLPYGYNAFWHLGVQAGAMASGTVKPGEGMINSARVAFDAFNPIGSGSLASMVAPTVADPAVDILANKNFFGGEIYPAANPFDQSPAPDSQRAWRSTHPAFKSAAEWINWLSGGNEIEPGYVDIHPDTLEHLWGFFTGGVGRWASQTTETAARAVQGEFEPKKTPWVRSFYGNVDEDNQKTEYYRQREATQRAKGWLKDYQAKGDPGELESFKKRYAVEIRAISAYDAAEKLRRKINKQRRAIENRNMNETDRKQQLERLDLIELEVMKRARAAFAKARRDQSNR